MLDYYNIDEDEVDDNGNPVVTLEHFDISGCTISWVALLGKRDIQNLEEGLRLRYSIRLFYLLNKI